MTTYFPDEVFTKILAYCGETYEEKRNRLWSYIKPNYEELMDEGVCPKIIRVSLISIQKGATLIDNNHKQFDLDDNGNNIHCLYPNWTEDEWNKNSDLLLNPEIVYRPNWDGNWGYIHENDRLINWHNFLVSLNII
jgi:hypothetical protein